MPKILFCGKGGSGKSTLLSLLALFPSEHHDVLVIDADESNAGLARMMVWMRPGIRSWRTWAARRLFADRWEKTAALEEKDPLGGALRSMAALPSSAASLSGRLTLVSVGKIEHAQAASLPQSRDITAANLTAFRLMWISTGRI